MTDHIRIGDVSPRVQYVADGVQAVFTYPFPIFAAGDLDVWLDAVRQEAGFVVAGAGASAGGTVTFDAAPAAGVRVTLRRRLAIQRVSDFQEGGDFRARTINDELDLLTAAVQQVAEDADRALHLEPSDTGATVLPARAARAGRFLAFDADGNPSAAIPTTFVAAGLTPADALKMQRANAAGTAWELRTPAEMRADIAAPGTAVANTFTQKQTIAASGDGEGVLAVRETAKTGSHVQASFLSPLLETGVGRTVTWLFGKADSANSGFVVEYTNWPASTSITLLRHVGAEANRGLAVDARGHVALGAPYIAGQAAFVAEPVAAQVNFLKAKGGATGTPAVLEAAGADTNIGIDLNTRGAGALRVNGAVLLDAGENIPVARLGAGAGASAATFWRGDGQWATPAGGGNVSGPASSSDFGLALFDGASGTLLRAGPAPGTAGHVLTSNGAGLAPSFQAPPGIADGAITTAKLADGAVTVAKIAANAVATDGANVGAGAGVFKDKSGTVLRLRTLKAEKVTQGTGTVITGADLAILASADELTIRLTVTMGESSGGSGGGGA